MAEFHNITVTQDGMKLIALASAMQKPLVFDRMDIGDSRPTDASKVASLTAVVNKRIEATISDIGVVTNADVSEARYRILGKYSNSSVTTGFKLSEVGVIAHVESNYYQDAGWNGYAGENLLFGYFYADEGKEDWLPSKDTLMAGQAAVRQGHHRHHLSGWICHRYHWRPKPKPAVGRHDLETHVAGPCAYRSWRILGEREKV